MPDNVRQQRRDDKTHNFLNRCFAVVDKDGPCFHPQQALTGAVNRQHQSARAMSHYVETLSQQLACPQTAYHYFHHYLASQWVNFGQISGPGDNNVGRRFVYGLLEYVS